MGGRVVSVPSCAAIAPRLSITAPQRSPSGCSEHLHAAFSRGKSNGRAVRAERFARRFEDSHQLKSFLTTGHRFGGVLDTVDEMLRERSQRLFLLQMRNVTIAVV